MANNKRSCGGKKTNKQNKTKNHNTKPNQQKKTHLQQTVIGDLSSEKQLCIWFMALRSELRYTVSEDNEAWP